MNEIYFFKLHYILSCLLEVLVLTIPLGEKKKKKKKKKRGEKNHVILSCTIT